MKDLKELEELKVVAVVVKTGQKAWWELKVVALLQQQVAKTDRKLLWGLKGMQPVMMKSDRKF